jgi:hypothetical protein
VGGSATLPQQQLQLLLPARCAAAGVAHLPAEVTRVHLVSIWMQTRALNVLTWN